MAIAVIYALECTVTGFAYVGVTAGKIRKPGRSVKSTVARASPSPW